MTMDLARADLPSIIDLVKHGQRDLAEAKTVWQTRGVRERAGAVKDLAARERRLMESQGIRSGVLDAELDASELWIDAYRHEGTLLRDMERAHAGDNQWSLQRVTTNAGLGYTHNIEVMRALKVSDVPESTVEDYKARQREKREPCTMAGLIRYWQDSMRRSLGDIDPPVGTYRTLVLDPPWPMDKSVRVDTPEQGSYLEYPTMTIDQIAALPIVDCSAPEAHLYMWVTQRFLPDGLALVEEWGFKYHCLLTWMKPGGFAPFSWMFNTEHVIFAYRGGFELHELGLNIGFQAPRGAHSEKPDCFYEMVERASFEPRLELFARRERPGWSVWGDEV